MARLVIITRNLGSEFWSKKKTVYYTVGEPGAAHSLHHGNFKTRQKAVKWAKSMHFKISPKRRVIDWDAHWAEAKARMKTGEIG